MGGRNEQANNRRQDGRLNQMNIKVLRSKRLHVNELKSEDVQEAKKIPEQ